MPTKFDNAKFKVAQKKYEKFLSMVPNDKYTVNTVSAENILNMAYDTDAGLNINLQIMLMAPDIDALIKVFGKRVALRRLQDALIKKDIRPSNMPIVMFAACPDLEFTGGSFSTYDINFSAKKIKGMTDDAVRKKVNKSIPNLKPLTGEYVKLWLDAIEYLKPAVESAVENFMFGELANAVLISLSKYVSKKLDVYGRAPLRIHIIDDWDDIAPEHRPAPEKADIAFGRTSFNASETHIFVNRGVIFNHLSDDKLIDKWERFAAMLATLAHEYTHFLDYRFPNLAHLGAQKSKIARPRYSAVHDEYTTNPTEKIAFTVDAQVAQQVIKHHHK